MIEAMWLWGAIGLVLLAVEMATGTFYVLWFGIAALCVSVTTWLFPELSSAIQFTIFAALSLASLTIWKLCYKKTETYSRVGQAQGEEIGRIGLIVESCGKTHNGKIQFTQGVMGSREWTVASNETIEVGSNAAIIAVEGNILRVQAV